MSTLRLKPGARAIGIILPSSNRVVEPVTQAILCDFPHVDACFTRVPYSGHPPDGYDMRPFQAAAGMLAQAGVDALCWNATRGALIGFEPDRQLCDMISALTSLPAVTTALATLDLLKSRGFRRIALLAQGTEAEGEQLKVQFGRNGIEIATGCNLGITDNLKAAHVSADSLRHAAFAVSRKAEADALLIWSTNLAGAGLVAELEAETGMPVLDSTAIGTLAALRISGVDLDPARTSGSVLVQGPRPEDGTKPAGAPAVP